MREQPAHDEQETTKQTSTSKSAEPGVTQSQTGSAAHVLHLQRTLGNATVARMIGDEQEDVQRSSVHGVLRSPGRPLDEPVRADMEARLGADFSDVRLHTGSTAARSAAEIGARAYTSGNHIVLGEGGADSHTLAHELTHVLQQRSGPVAGTDNGAGLRISDPSDRFEREAEAVATHVMSREHAIHGQRESDPPTRTHSGGGSVQRQVKHENYKDDLDSGARKVVEEFFKACDQAVQKAYDYVVQVPGLGARQGTDGHTRQWVQLWDGYLSSGSTKRLAMSFGYVVESLVSNDSDFSPAAPNGWKIGYQVSVAGTRPDLVLKRGDEHVAWLDITSFASAGHVLEKDGWGRKIGTFAEATYPALDASTLLMMRGNKDNSGSLSAEEFNKRKEEASKRVASLRAHWKELGKNFQKSSHNEGLKRAGLNNEVANLGHNPGEGLEKYIKSYLETYFNAPIDKELVPSVLHAMDVDVKPWGFVFVTRDAGSGELWLMDNDKNAPA